MDKKYEFTGETLEWHDSILHQIKATRNFSDVKTGDIGGWIEKEENLSHEGDCWIYDSARVYSDAKIRDNAVIKDKAEISGKAIIKGNAEISKNSKIGGIVVIS